MFTPVQTFLGGLLLHLSTQSMLEDNGRVFGISGITSEALLGDHARWRLATVAGLIAGPAVVHAVGIAPYVPDATAWTWSAFSVGRLALAGGLIGFGSKLGSGCTSGHMLCGVSRLSPRSLVATAVFFATAVLTQRLFPAALHEAGPAYAASLPSTSGTLALLGTVLGFYALKQAADRLVPAVVKCPPAPDSAAAAAAVDSPAGLLPYLLSGLTFGAGLCMSGMISSMKVLGFLRLPPPMDTFDPSLALVIAGGVLPNAVAYYNMMAASNGKPKPRFGWESWRVPTRKDINVRLVAGAAIFGAGWGLCGVCPGPAISTLGEILVAAAQGAGAEKLAPMATGWAAYAANMVLGFGAVKLLDKYTA